MAALSLQGVKKTYDGKQFVLHGIDVQVADGEFVVMVGPSGCGKSTLLRMVAGTSSSRRIATLRWCSRTTRFIRT
jgi:sn-glycerol 3-phosphate transport system ATP-binding protein